MVLLPDEDMARLQVDVPEDLKTDAKVEALKRGVTLSEIVENALRDYLKKNQAKK